MKKITALILSINMLLCTGCTSKKIEVRDRAYVQGAVLDGNEEIRLTLYPFEGAGSAVESTGNTLKAAIENASVNSGQEVFMGHLELLCFDDLSFTDKLRSCLLDYRISPGCKLLFLSDGKLPKDTDTTLLTDRLIMEEEKGIIPETDLFHVLSEQVGDDGAMLVPALDGSGFSMCIINGNEPTHILSDSAAEGLCWLRGENFPERLSVAGESGTEDYEIYSARTKLSAEIRDGIPCVTVNIRLKGSGNAEAAKQLITVLCEKAEEETLKKMNADVIGLSTCLARDCPEYYAQQDTDTAKLAVNFEHIILTE